MLSLGETIMNSPNRVISSFFFYTTTLHMYSIYLLSFSSVSHSFFFIRQHYICILFVFCHLVLFLTHHEKDVKIMCFMSSENRSMIYLVGHGLVFTMTSWLILRMYLNVTFTRKKNIHVLKTSVIKKANLVSDIAWMFC